ncbi:rod shape-determining protein MreC [Seonamhaeicola maritimus]|uniref:rod shape-determining protein MreC n=1 Tax=Seonamhaeicola maritimus TaxID=2591822 RepID=UPI002494B8DE|nr:rod shape-determining protein MreC [Seonamhaeicola maritimus]
MQQIINFIIRNKNFLLFLSLFFISIVFTIQSHSYHKSKFINSANFLSGGIYNSVNDISGYFNLKSQNQLLSEENNRLKELLFNIDKNKDSVFTNNTSFEQAYKFYPANIIKNNFSLTDNILTINKGKRDSIKEDFGVITTKGIVGIVDKTSNRFGTVISILNTNSRISAQLKKSGHLGSLKWNGKSSELVQLVDIQINANLKKGDTIITSGQSSIFPKNIGIGTIQDFNNDAAGNFYEINVKLFNDMTNLEHVYLIENVHREEINTLLNE